jgi:hypothetical protein
MVGVLLFCSAYVARYSLPDHRISPCPHSVAAAGPAPMAVAFNLFHRGMAAATMADEE